MRWKLVLAGLALAVTAVGGCTQQCWLSECDYDHYRNLAPMTKLECDPQATAKPITELTPPPKTLLDTDRPPRYMTLNEAIAMALERGTVGPQSAFNYGTPGQTASNFAVLQNDSFLSFAGTTVAGSDSIRALSLDPATVGANIEDALSKFDAQWTSSMTWNEMHIPTESINSFNAGQTATFTSSLLKPLPTGGVAGITFSTQYQFLSRAVSIAGVQVLNPSYTPQIQFQFEQPLLQGYGVEINQLRATHPNSILTPFTSLLHVSEGILLTRIRFDEQRAQFELNVHFMVANVETAYWNLYGSYWTLYANEQGVRQSFEAWRINRARFEAGRIPIMDFAQSRQQYELFVGQRITALGQVLEAERTLRGLLNLPAEDGTRIVPVDTPTLAPLRPDWTTALNEALTLRPDLVLARQDLKSQQLNLINAKNLLLPDLRFTSTYSLQGIGTQLDGGQLNALRSLATGDFPSWSLGLRLTVPIGFRDAHVQVRQARLTLARSYMVLREQELKAQRLLARQYELIFENYEQIRAQRAQREAAATQLEGRFREFLAGRGTLDILLEAQRVYAVALQGEYNAIVSYNTAIVGWELAKGTILQHNNITIGEGLLPKCAQVRAVEHERERAKALLLRERALPVAGRDCCAEKGCFGILKLPANEAPALPSLLEGEPPAPDISTEPGPAPAGSADLKAGPATVAAPPADAAGKGVPGMIYSGPDSLPLPAETPPASSLPAPAPTPPNGASALPKLP